MPRPKLEIADIIRDYGPAWRRANAGHVNLSQLKVMSAIEACRTEALGGHVAACTKCNHQHIAYNSCKNATVPNVRDRQHVTEWRHEPKTCYQLSISTWFSLCQRRSPVSPIGIRRLSMACCSERPPKLFPPSLPIPNVSAQGSA